MNALPTLDAFACVAACLVLCYIPHAVKAVAVGRKNRANAKHKGAPYNIKDPRSSVASALDTTTEEGRFISRAQSCHMNALENWPFIAAAVLAAAVTGVPRATQDYYATLHLLFRFLYIPAFLFGTSYPIALARSTVWLGGIVCVFALFYASVLKRSA